MIKEKLAEVVKNAVLKSVESGLLGNLKECNEETLLKIVIERSKKIELADFSCNISFLARDAKMAPPKIAEKIVENLDPETKKFFNISFVAGFINFKLTEVWLTEVISEILNRREEFAKADYGNNKKVLLEYVSANPTGPLHLGHGRWAALGSCIESLLKFTGYDVTTEFYINDAGVQIKNLGHSLFLRVLQELDPGVYFPIDKESDPRAAGFYPGAYLVDIAKKYITEHIDQVETFKSACNVEDKLYIPSDEIISIFSEYAKPIILEQQKVFLERFKTIFDVWYSETSLHQSGLVDGIIGFLESKSVLYEKDAAVWFASSQLADTQDRVIRKSDGTLTYLTADIAYHKTKYDRGFEHLINIWGADHHGYVPRMKSAVQAIGKDPESLEVLIGQMVNLIVDGAQMRMGKRKKMVTLEELVDDVGVDATRFWMVSRGIDTTLDFDVDLAKSKSDENPVFYVQYAHARCCSILRTATSDRIDSENNQTLTALLSKSELNTLLNKFKQDSSFLKALLVDVEEKQKTVTKQLIIYLESYKDTIYKASRDRAPHYVARYLIDLASCYHSFYNECRVLNLNPAYSIPEELQNVRIALIDATRQVLYNGLSLLGVSAPDSM